MCEKGEFCEYGYLVHQDKEVIDTGFNIFMFLHTFKEVSPTLDSLANFDSQFKNDLVYNKMKKEY